MSEPVVDIDPTQAHDLHESGAVVLLDVREPEEWQAGHAPGALHIPLGDLDADRVAGSDIVVVCRSGNRSGQAVQRLAASGVPARNMTGGMKAWAADGLPIVTPQGGPGTIA
ncbi:MAG: rhodanese-like domain-containing protein [Aeromicrobium sp.]|uniref:rhodanese-like domain-containing protein n=1 Tax=Aeromicrobium sp. TaxID=1871063 RepID=UPI003C66CEE0